MTRKSQKAIAERKKQTCEVNTGAKREKKDILSFFSLFPSGVQESSTKAGLVHFCGDQHSKFGERIRQVPGKI